MERLIIVPDEKESASSRLLVAKATQIAGQITAQNMASLIGEIGLRLAAMKDAQAGSELILWGKSADNFLAAWTSLAPESDVVEVGLCQGSSGLVAEIFATETSRSHTEPLLQASVWTNLADRRGRQIVGMRGVPVSVFGQCVGALTWVGYENSAASTEDALAKLAAIFSRFAELRILKMLLGMEADA